MNVLALDQATYSTGYSIWDKKNKILLKYGLIKIKGTNVWDRLYQLIQEIEIICNQWDIKEIYIEDIQYQEDKEYQSFEQGVNNVKTFKTLAWLQGVIMYWSYIHNINIETLFSSQWKSFCKIKGTTRSVQKQNSIKFVYNIFREKVESDIADSICLGWTILNK